MSMGKKAKYDGNVRFIKVVFCISGTNQSSNGLHLTGKQPRFKDILKY